MAAGLFSAAVSAQQWIASEIQPDTVFDNVHAQVLHADSLTTCTVIWIRKEVRPHYHAHHTEQITVLQGRGEMRLGDETFIIRKGDWIVIPRGMVHAVRVRSNKPLKVISVQSPHFVGTDRIMVDE
jgi:mannose-6-phosphate isomerase-like protein (cupin superfamily)